MERLRNFVGGEWLDQGVDSTDINPSDVKDVIAEYARADSKVTADAIEASSNAANKWGTSNVQERADILDSIGDEILNKGNPWKIIVERRRKNIARGYW